MKQLVLLVIFVAIGTMLSGCSSSNTYSLGGPTQSSSNTYSLGGPTQSAVSAEEAEKIVEVITKLDQQWSQTALTKDTAFLKSIWADDLRFTQPDGKVFDKEAALADVEGDTDTVTSSVISAYKVRVYGKNFAVVAGDYHSTGKDKDGKPFSRKFRFTGAWVRKQMSTGERKWQCVSDHASKLE